MSAAPDRIDGSDVCGMCNTSLLTTRYVYVQAPTYHVLCSKSCVREAAREERRERWAARRRSTKRWTVGLVLAGGLLTPHQGPARPPSIKRPATLTALPSAGPPPLPPGWFGPEWPPSEMSLLAALGRDTWVHPLAGPVRRMPRADSRVFGAVRPGSRPAECRNGHCGVDLGGEIWGEHVHAVHDGVVDFVQRGLNPDRGGSFVRLSHRDGTVFSWYFHLAAIPRGLERGTYVTSGQVIGLLGDTGVKESAPHLHFAISARPASGAPERYMDPEPLIALWPLRVPIDGSENGLVTTVARAGVPLGSARPIPGRNRKPAKRGRTREEAAPADGVEVGAPSETGETGETDEGAAVEAPAAARGGRGDRGTLPLSDGPRAEPATDE